MADATEHEKLFATVGLPMVPCPYRPTTSSCGHGPPGATSSRRPRRCWPTGTHPSQLPDAMTNLDAATSQRPPR